MHFYGWKKGLKTGMYYLRIRAASQAIQFTVDHNVLNDAKKTVTGPNGNGIMTPSPSPSPVTISRIKQEPVTPIVSNGRSYISAHRSDTSSVAPESPTHSHFGSPLSEPTSMKEPEPLSLDGLATKAAAVDPEFAAALQRQRDRELAEAKLQCSLENKEACLMCSG